MAQHCWIRSNFNSPVRYWSSLLVTLGGQGGLTTSDLVDHPNIQIFKHTTHPEAVSWNQWLRCDTMWLCQQCCGSELELCFLFRSGKTPSWSKDSGFTSCFLLLISWQLKDNPTLTSFFQRMSYSSFQLLADAYLNEEASPIHNPPTVLPTAPELVKLAFTYDFTAKVARLSRQNVGHITGLGNRYLQERFEYQQVRSRALLTKY